MFDRAFPRIILVAISLRKEIKARDKHIGVFVLYKSLLPLFRLSFFLHLFFFACLFVSTRIHGGFLDGECLSHGLSLLDKDLYDHSNWHCHKGRVEHIGPNGNPSLESFDQVIMRSKTD